MKSQLIKNQIISNDFNMTFQNPKIQSQSFEKSINTSSKNPFQSSSKKSSRIKQTKQLLALKLKEVTPFQQTTQNYHQHKNKCGQSGNLMQQKKDLQCHLNPISKIIKQPFVRSKTCQQMRKEFSLKKERKRNNSASKFSTPNTDLSSKQIQSTGINSNKLQFDKNTSNKKSSQKQISHDSKIETKQFSIDPFSYGGHMIQTFNKERIEKLITQDSHKNKMKSKLTLGTRMVKNSNDVVDLPTQTTQMNFPFKINLTANKKIQADIQSPLVLQASFKNIQEKFTPRLQRYPLSGELSQRKSAKKKSDSNIESIQLSQESKDNKFYRHEIRTLQESPEYEEQSNHINEDTSYDYSSQSQFKDSEYMQQPSSSFGYSAQQLGYPNELVASLHMTNTILQQKLKLKDQEIQELNRHYFQLKTELIHVKNSQEKKKSIANDIQTFEKEINTFKSKPPSYKYPQHLSNFDLQMVHSIDTTQYNISQALNNTQSNSSPRFCDGVQEEFSRQRQITQQHSQKLKIYQNRQQSNNSAESSNFYKKKELYQSSLSEQVSEQFDSQEINQSNRNKKYEENKYNFKKNNFYESQVKNKSENSNKRDSLVYTLNDDIITESDHKDRNRSFFNSQAKKQSSHIPTQEMLLDSRTDQENHLMQSSSEEDRISQLSPIRPNQLQKMEPLSYHYTKYRRSSKPQNTILEESFLKFDYYLTPQKDQSKIYDEKSMPQQEGLFEKAISTIKQSKNSNLLDNSLEKVVQDSYVDSIIETNQD